MVDSWDVELDARKQVRIIGAPAFLISGPSPTKVGCT